MQINLPVVKYKAFLQSREVHNWQIKHRRYAPFIAPTITSPTFVL